MIDSTRLSRAYASPLAKSTLRRFYKRGDYFILGNDAEHEEGYKPRLIYNSAAYGGCYYLLVQCSLPKVLYGTNLRVLTDEEIGGALTLVSDYVRRHAGVDFDVSTANVGRVDFCFNFSVGEPQVYSYLRAAMEAAPPHLKRHVFGDIETVAFINKARRYTLYSKRRETEHQVTLGRADEADVQLADGLLRAEARLANVEAVKGLTQRLGLPNREAQSVLRCDVARLVLNRMLNELELDRPITSSVVRLNKLKESLGYGMKFQKLAGFLALCNAYGGESLVRSGAVKRASYYEQRKVIQSANAWVHSPDAETLPALLIR